MGNTELAVKDLDRIIQDLLDRVIALEIEIAALPPAPVEKPSDPVVAAAVDEPTPVSAVEAHFLATYKATTDLKDGDRVRAYGETEWYTFARYIVNSLDLTLLMWFYENDYPRKLHIEKSTLYWEVVKPD